MGDTRVDRNAIRDIVQLACRAPSLFNSQPWRWIAENNALQLFLDKDRVLPSTDHSGREALIGCGAALDHLRVASAAQGWRVNVDRLPNPNNPQHLASIGFRPAELVTEGHRRRAETILQRHTDRLPFVAPPDWDSVEAQLHRSVTSAAVRLDVIADELRPELANASRLTASLRLYDTSYHSELSWWTGPFESVEGVPHNTLVSASEADRVQVGRDFPRIQHGDRRPGYRHDESKILVLSTHDNDRTSVLECGEMLSAVLLEATMEGLATCPLTHITELWASRDIVSRLIGQSTTPQVLVRVGLAPAHEDPPPPTLRRPIDEVLKIREQNR
ncbi:MAG: NAD(P)H nitroreductase [Actinomycetota bacterium]|nr:NAD(P)H nitroreductase [Actinomycetota bacterium]